MLEVGCSVLIPRITGNLKNFPHRDQWEDSEIALSHMKGPAFQMGYFGKEIQNNQQIAFEILLKLMAFFDSFAFERPLN